LSGAPSLSRMPKRLSAGGACTHPVPRSMSVVNTKPRAMCVCRRCSHRSRAFCVCTRCAYRARAVCVCVCVHAHTESCALIPSATASMIPSGGLKKACCSAAQCVAMRGAKWTRHLLVPPWSGLRKAHCMSLFIQIMRLHTAPRAHTCQDIIKCACVRVPACRVCARASVPAWTSVCVRARACVCICMYVCACIALHMHACICIGVSSSPWRQSRYLGLLGSLETSAAQPS
jgi:hypothetical protein